jgi:hypothetical protein
MYIQYKPRETKVRKVFIFQLFAETAVTADPDTLIAGRWYELQCCQVAEIPARKLKKGPRKKDLVGRVRGRILAEFFKKWQKRVQRKCSKEIPYFTVMTNTQ